MLRLHARAKINWTLDIIGTRQDGYHQMDMLMESVQLADTLIMEESDTLRLSIEGNESLSDTDNLVLRAALALQKAAGCARGAYLSLQKRIPVGAGMGGGSADAAAALIGLTRLWKAGKSLSELQAIGLTLGADVPFLLHGGLARVGGIGEEICPLPKAATATLLVIQPCPALSTREVFHAYETMPSPRHPDTERAQQALLVRDYAVFSGAAG
ncbi:MAG: 4-(cytidine 5'-diphospho)-2-C-methyl-D-erythritol kinase, partial [Clostridia bacterium]|nr:4-(cytidine 5'-diphospho)-2-C-methyl-D-erythritol kinase [Clostridia bacterium]